MHHFYQTIGEDWFTYPNLYSEMVQNAKDGSKFVEVGAWKGRSASFMAVEILNSQKRILFDVVDTWKGSAEHMGQPILQNDGLYFEFLKNIEPVNEVIKPIRMPSLEAAQNYPDNSLDFVFIDASHEYEDVIADLAAWYPKVKIGGVLAGHDYPTWEGVTRAVNDFFDQIERPFISTNEMCFVCHRTN